MPSDYGIDFPRTEVLAFLLSKTCYRCFLLKIFSFIFLQISDTLENDTVPRLATTVIETITIWLIPTISLV